MCGDILRKKADSNYHTFSVGLDDWIDELVDQSGSSEDGVVGQSGSNDNDGEEQKKKRIKLKSGKAEFSGVQACRNFL